MKNAEGANDYTNYFEGKHQVDLLDMGDTTGPGLVDLLSGTTSASSSTQNVLDLLADPKSNTSQLVGGIDEMMSALDLGTRYVQVPYRVVVPATATGAQKQASGLEVEAAVQKSGEGMQCRLNLRIKNTTSQILRNFLFKLNSNFFGMSVDQGL